MSGRSGLLRELSAVRYAYLLPMFVAGGWFKSLYTTRFCKHGTKSIRKSADRELTKLDNLMTSSFCKTSLWHISDKRELIVYKLRCHGMK